RPRRGTPRAPRSCARTGSSDGGSVLLPHPREQFELEREQVRLPDGAVSAPVPDYRVVLDRFEGPKVLTTVTSRAMSAGHAAVVRLPGRATGGQGRRAGEPGASLPP